MVYGFSREKLAISLRTEQEHLGADKLMHRIVARKGTGGGHPSYAGGQISISGLSQKQIEKLEKLIISRYVKSVVPSSTKPENLIQV